MLAKGDCVADARVHVRTCGSFHKSALETLEQIFKANSTSSDLITLMLISVQTDNKLMPTISGGNPATASIVLALAALRV